MEKLSKHLTLINFKKSFLAAGLFMLCLNAIAQSEETENRLNSIRFKSITPLSPKSPPGGYLDLTVSGNKLTVGSTTFGDKAYLATDLAVNEDLNVRLHFLNPLLYNVSIKLSEKDDPSASAFDSFLKQMSGTFGSVTELGALKSFALPASPPMTTFPSVILKDFLYAISDERFIEKSYYDDVAEKISGIESFLYGDISNVCNCSSNGNVLSIMSKAITDLSKETTFSDFDKNSADLSTNLKQETRDCIGTVNKLLEDLKTSIKDAKNHVRASVVRTPAAPYAAKDLASFKTAIDSYAQATAQWVEVFTNKDMKMVSDRVTAFSALIDALRKFVIEKNKSGLVSAEYLPYGSQKLSHGKDIGVSLRVISLELTDDLTTKPKDTMNINFTIIKNKPQLEVALGAAWLANSYTFNNYFVNNDNGTYTLANTTTTKILLPTLFLNYYVHLRKLDMNVILPQIGVTTGKEYPTVLIGAGFSEFNRFSLTSGAAFLVNQKLSPGYTEGMTLDDEAVIKDVSKTYYHKFTASWYISLNYRLTK
jgi:hypothetical protein